jgi:hypothetical protein
MVGDTDVNVRRESVGYLAVAEAGCTCNSRVQDLESAGKIQKEGKINESTAKEVLDTRWEIVQEFQTPPWNKL